MRPALVWSRVKRKLGQVECAADSPEVRVSETHLSEQTSECFLLIAALNDDGIRKAVLLEETTLVLEQEGHTGDPDQSASEVSKGWRMSGILFVAEVHHPAAC
jgi:hypothetical protein